MGDYRRILLLILIMTAVAGSIGVAAISILYNTAFDEERARLVETAQSQARLMEAVARFDQVHSLDYPDGAVAATISQIRAAHEQYLGFGDTGEFTLARREEERIVFVVRHRHSRLDQPQPVPFDSNLAQPMRRALSGRSGTMIGRDYRGETVLAAFEPIAVLDLGIVAKIDLAEIRAPFLRAAGIVFGIAIVLIAAGTMLFFRVSNPMVRRIRDSEERLKTILDTTTSVVFLKDPQGRHILVNRQYEVAMGLSKNDVLGKTCHDFLPRETADRLRASDRAVLDDGVSVQLEESVPGPHGMRHYIATKAPLKDESGKVYALCGMATDITERKRAEAALTARVLQQAAVAELGRHALAGADLDTLFSEAVTQVADCLRVEYVKVLELLPDGKNLLLSAGVGWKDGYVGGATVSAGRDSQAGFTLLSEEPLLVDDLRTETRFSGPPLLHEHGIIGGVSVIIAGKDRPFGVLGAHTGNRRTFSADDINFLRAVANVLAESVRRTRAEEALHKAHDELEMRVKARTADLTAANRRLEEQINAREEAEEELRYTLRYQEIVASILRISLQPIPLDEVLEQTLSLVLTGHGLSLESKGCIFLVDDDTRELAMKVRRGLPDTILKSCSRVPFGQCICGQVAATREVIHTNKIDDGHELSYSGMVPHGHYCAPIKSDGSVLGVVNLYVPEGHRWLDVEERFVAAVADTLAGVIHRKRAEEALAETQAEYQDLYDHAPDMFASVDVKTANVIQCNQTLADALGYSKDEIIGRRVFDLYQAECLSEVRGAFKAFLETGEVRDAELQLRRKDGSKIDVSLSMTAVRDENGEVTYSRSAWRDVTESKLTEERARGHQAQLAHVARLSTVGEMSSGIAHEVNQPLTAMVTSTQACLRMMESGAADVKKLRNALRDVTAQGLRAGEIIRRLREFTRFKETKRTTVDFNALVREAVGFVETETHEKGISMRLELAGELPMVVVDTIQVEQVVLNLLRNAMDAMEGTAAAERMLAVRTRENEAGAVELLVRDTGPGLRAEAADRIFDPFFTTKADGMGMGLSISRSIVEAHKGHLWADPPHGEGAMFHLTLPSTLEVSHFAH